MSSTHLALSYGNTLEIVLKNNPPSADTGIEGGFFFRRYMENKKYLIYILFLIFGIFFMNYAAMKFYWYSSIWYFDMPMHFFGGFWLSLASIWFLNKQKDIFSLPSSFWKLVLIYILNVFIIGIFWEVFEIFIDKSITHNYFNILDTVSDLFFDLSGGFFAIYIFMGKPILTFFDNV